MIARGLSRGGSAMWRSAVHEHLLGVQYVFKIDTLVILRTMQVETAGSCYVA